MTNKLLLKLSKKEYSFLYLSDHREQLAGSKEVILQI